MSDPIIKSAREDVRLLRLIWRHVERLSPAGRRWLAKRLTADLAADSDAA